MVIGGINIFKLLLAASWFLWYYFLQDFMKLLSLRELKLLALSPRGILVFKSFIAAVSWYFLPFWVFVLIAGYFYFAPFFRSTELALPAALFIFFASTEESSIWFAVLFAALFYLVLGIKNLILINREQAHESLSLLLVLLLTIEFFIKVDGLGVGSTIFYSLAISVFVFFLTKNFIGQVVRETNVFAGNQTRINVSLSIISFLIWQLLLVLTFAPLNFLYQSSTLIISTATLFEFFYGHASGVLTRRRILINSSIFLVFTATVLGSAQWGL